MEEIRESLRRLLTSFQDLDLSDEEYIMVQDIFFRLESDIEEYYNTSETFDKSAYINSFDLFTNISYIAHKTNLLQQLEPSTIRNALISAEARGHCKPPKHCREDELIDILIRQISLRG